MMMSNANLNSFYLDSPSSRSLMGPFSSPSFNKFNSSSVKLCLEWGKLLVLAFSTSTAQLYITIPATATSIPRIFLKVNSESNKSHPKVKTHTVFMWPRTWNETAENRPMQRYWLMLQKTANEHEISMNICNWWDWIRCRGIL